MADDPVLKYAVVTKAWSVKGTVPFPGSDLEVDINFYEGDVLRGFTQDKFFHFSGSEVNIGAAQPRITFVGVVKIPVENLQFLVEEKPIVEEPPMPPEREAASYKLSSYTAKEGRHRPSANLFQLVATQLGWLKELPEWKLNADGVFGSGTKRVAELIQTAYKLSPIDGEVGQGTWRAVTPDLGSWRPPLRLRIAECQCSWEAGSNTYGYSGLIKKEGWWNYGIWNVNKDSAKTLTALGGASHLHTLIAKADSMGTEANPYAGRDVAAEVGSWFGSKDGRETQVGPYFIKYILRPSIKNLIGCGWKISDLGFANEDELNAASTSEEVDTYLANVTVFFERLILLACDITVNSGAGGFYPMKSPRAWESKSPVNWPMDRLPFKEGCKQIYAEAFGGTIANDYTYLTSDTRETYKQALTKCLWEVCQTDEQRIALIGELQARCVIDTWREDIIRRRRAASWVEGFTFQDSPYCVLTDFGIGI